MAGPAADARPMPSPQNCLEEFNLGLTATAIGVIRCPCELSQFTVLFGVSARCASAAIGAERVLRVKRKGRTGFKPSGLRDELPDLPVPFVN